MKKIIFIALFVSHFAFGQSNIVNPKNTIINANLNGPLIYLNNTNTGTSATGLYAETASTLLGIGVLGVANATTPSGHTYGVYGSNNSVLSNGYGLYGLHSGSGVGVHGESTGGYGVEGKSNSSVGVYGSSSTLASVGIFGSSTNGTAGYFNSLTGNALITNSGNVGIGVTPNLNNGEIIDIFGRIRVRHNVTGNITAGIWMNNNVNSINGNDGAFYGMKLNTEAGIFIGGAWKFWVNNSGVINSTGGISVGGGETIAKVIKKSVVVDLPFVAAGGTFIFIAAVTGAEVGDNVIFNPRQLMNGLTINHYTITASDFVTIRFTNNGSDYDAPSMNFDFTIFR